jgi:protein disulfide-isomerase A6
MVRITHTHTKSLSSCLSPSPPPPPHSDGVVIAKVDADKERDLGERFEVKGFPTLKWFPKVGLPMNRVDVDNAF